MSNEQTKHSSWEYFLLRAARKISLSAAQYSVIDARYSQLEKFFLLPMIPCWRMPIFSPGFYASSDND